MKLFQINGAVFGSTGKIMIGIAEAAERQGYEVLCAAPITKTNWGIKPTRNYIRIGTYYGRCASVLLSRLTGLDGCFAVFATLKLLQRMKNFQPDVVHLHNIHGSYINLPLLFRFLKKYQVRVVWTLHDCWSFTGHCPHFDMIGCQKWKGICSKCPQYREYPKSYIDNSKYMHNLKRRWFTGLQNVTIITPSDWLANLVKQSFLKDYQIRVIPNGINLDIFRPTPSDFRTKHRCEEKFIVLGVSSGWSNKKGLDVFVELAKRLDDRFQIVLVGTDEKADKLLPKNIISIHCTQNQVELAAIYTVADVFVNPSREETMGLVTVEALACGTPVVVCDCTAVPEVVDENCGTVIGRYEIDALEREVELLCENLRFSQQMCREKAKCFDEIERCKEVVRCYEKTLSNN